MEQAMENANLLSTEALSLLSDGMYKVYIHGYETLYKIENCRIFGKELKGKKECWYETFLEAPRLKKMEKIC